MHGVQYTLCNGAPAKVIAKHFTTDHHLYNLKT